jgi:hypothetical protein
MRYPLLLALPLAFCASASAHELSNARITAVLADGSAGLNTTTMDRVDSLSWINSDGVSTGNIVANSGGSNCGDPQEFFGQSYGDTDGNNLLMVVLGASAKWKQNDDLGGTSKTTGENLCVPLGGKTTTAYSLSAHKNLENTIRM